jgi:hypothetical protein
MLTDAHRWLPALVAHAVDTSFYASLLTAEALELSLKCGARAGPYDCDTADSVPGGKRLRELVCSAELIRAVLGLVEGMDGRDEATPSPARCSALFRPPWPDNSHEAAVESWRHWVPTVLALCLRRCGPAC